MILYNKYIKLSLINEVETKHEKADLHHSYCRLTDFCLL